MEIITHKINSIKLLKKIPKKYGVEVDLRTNGSKIILNHEPSSGGDTFKNYLENYRWYPSQDIIVRCAHGTASAH